MGFKIKEDGNFISRLVALGYSQVSGSDFNENFSPVVNDITLRILITLSIINDWNKELIDIITDFYVETYRKIST